ncbi:MAG TPA: hypothetical protein VFL77_05490, partial [Solirubrobacterales bacterium]|nr:hypothetical protein [Solirubrobacterales bacterium]
ARGFWEFVVGDDWRVALWVVATIAATAAIAAVGWPAWWLTPTATLAILRDSVRRGSRPISTEGSESD